jgi:hypothetical protein
MFEYNLSDKDYAANVTFKVHVTDRVVLDENSTVAPTAQNGVNVTVIRTIQAGVWNTICLPFAMTEAQLKAAFGNDVQLCYFKDYSIAGDDITINFLSWDKSYGLLKNYPLLIKTNSDINSFVIENVNIEPNNAEAKYEKNINPVVTEVYGRFIGTMKAGTTVPENYLFLNANKLYYSTGSTVIKGFRGYFQLQGFDPSANAPTFRVDGGTTRVEGLSVVTDDGTIYNLNGQKVHKGKRGLYIINGKKVMARP